MPVQSEAAEEDIYHREEMLLHMISHRHQVLMLAAAGDMEVMELVSLVMKNCQLQEAEELQAILILRFLMAPTEL